MAYYCTHCHYKHDKDNKIPIKCPYCSSEGTIKKSQTAQDLLNSIVDEMEVVDRSKKERQNNR